MKKLPTVRWHERLYDDQVNLDDLAFAKVSPNRAVIKDSASKDQLIIEGHDLKYSGGVIDSGIIEKVTFADVNGRPHQVFSNFHLNAGIFNGDTISEYAGSLIQGVYSRVRTQIGTSLSDSFVGNNGNNKQYGLEGDDTLNGGKGHDVLSGGAGSDQFVFVKGFGKDVIADFDAVGGWGEQDFIIAGGFPGESSIEKSGRDTIIDFGDGDTLTLIGVKPGQIDVSDFL